jgi:hypothetical protein
MAKFPRILSAAEVGWGRGSLPLPATGSLRGFLHGSSQLAWGDSLGSLMPGTDTA